MTTKPAETDTDRLRRIVLMVRLSSRFASSATSANVRNRATARCPLSRHCDGVNKIAEMIKLTVFDAEREATDTGLTSFVDIVQYVFDHPDIKKLLLDPDVEEFFQIQAEICCEALFGHPRKLQ
jgi:hypothetical protein